MTNETPKTPESKESKEAKESKQPREPKKILFGSRLLAAREAMGLEKKEVANQLRLPESVIQMMESEIYTSDLPVTFIRGYIRAYAKFLQIPEADIIKALEHIKPIPTNTNVVPLGSRNLDPVTSDYYFMQIFSYLVGITLVGLVGAWAYTHYTPGNKIVVESVINTPENGIAKLPIRPVAVTNAVTAPVNTQGIAAPLPAPTPSPVVATQEEKPIAVPEKESKPLLAQKVKKAEPIAEGEDEESYSDEPDSANND